MTPLTIILTIAGVVTGANIFRGLGWVYGGLTGFLLGKVIDLNSRLNKLETKIRHDAVESASHPFQKPSEQLFSPLPPDEMDEEEPETSFSTPNPPPLPFEILHHDMMAEENHEPEKIVPPQEEAVQAPLKKEPAPGSKFPDMEGYIKDFFTKGNVVVKIGLIVLFFGISFLLKYAAEKNRLPIELRFIGAALSGLILLVIGWRKREQRRTFALLLQGGGIGIMYITVFAAAKLFSLIPPGLAFLFMVLLVVLSGLLAVLQNARQTALFGAIGGFIAPVLVSTGSGNHIMLFSYYALLNFGILGISWYKAWRELNVVGFLFTFVIGSLWGYHSYRQEMFYSSQFFLILFFLLYTLVAILFAHRQPPELKGYVDGSLVFALPVVFFSLECYLVRQFQYGFAFCALGMSGFYILLARALWNRQILGMRMLTEAFLSLGVVFGSLAIPLSVDGRWTSAAWAMEGCGLVWIGVRQHRILSRHFGYLLQAGAGISFLSSLLLTTGNLPVVNGYFIGCVIVSFSGFFSGSCLNRHKELLKSWEPRIAIGLIFWGFIWWYWAGLHEIEVHLPEQYEMQATILFMCASAWMFHAIENRIAWKLFLFPWAILLPVMIIALFTDLNRHTGSHPFRFPGNIIWPISIFIQYYILYKRENKFKQVIRHFEHAGSLLWVVFMISWEFSFWLKWMSDGNPTWDIIAWGLVPSAVAFFILKQGHRIPWPVAAHLSGYQSIWIIPLLCGVFVWCLFTSLELAGNPGPLPYIPILNPLELVHIGSIFVLFSALFQITQNNALQLPDHYKPATIYLLSALSFIVANTILARSVHFFGHVPYQWEVLLKSGVLQTCFSIFWNLLALTIMVISSRVGNRKAWFTGAVLLGVVVVKLFFIDLSGTGTIQRIISFIVAGALMLVIGYFSPVPPTLKKDRPS